MNFNLKECTNSAKRRAQLDWPLGYEVLSVEEINSVGSIKSADESQILSAWSS